MNPEKMWHDWDRGINPSGKKTAFCHSPKRVGEYAETQTYYLDGIGQRFVNPKPGAMPAK